MFNELITSKTRIALLRLFLLNPSEKYYLRETARKVKKNPNAVRVELNRLEKTGILKSDRTANLKYYSLNDRNPLTKELCDVILLEDSLQNKQKALKEFTKKAKEKHEQEVEEITLYGSYARGEAKPESDIDVLVTVKGNRFKMLKNLVDIAYDIMLKYREYISIKTITPQEKQQMTQTVFMKNILKEGKVLYG